MDSTRPANTASAGAVPDKVTKQNQNQKRAGTGANHAKVVPVEDVVRLRDAMTQGISNLQLALANLSSAYVNNVNSLLTKVGGLPAADAAAMNNGTLDPNALFLAGRGADPNLQLRGTLSHPQMYSAADMMSTVPDAEMPHITIGEGMDNLAPGQMKFGKRKRVPHDKNAPKRALTPFFLFLHSERARVMEEMGPNHTPKEMQDEGARRWREMGDAEKQIWDVKYKINLARYRELMKAYKAGRPLPEISDYQAQQLYLNSLEESGENEKVGPVLEKIADMAKSAADNSESDTSTSEGSSESSVSSTDDDDDSDDEGKGGQQASHKTTTAGSANKKQKLSTAAATKASGKIAKTKKDTDKTADSAAYEHDSANKALSGNKSKNKPANMSSVSQARASSSAQPDPVLDPALLAAADDKKKQQDAEKQKKRKGKSEVGKTNAGHDHDNEVPSTRAGTGGTGTGIGGGNALSSNPNSQNKATSPEKIAQQASAHSKSGQSGSKRGKVSDVAQMKRSTVSDNDQISFVQDSNTMNTMNQMDNLEPAARANMVAIPSSGARASPQRGSADPSATGMGTAMGSSAGKSDKLGRKSKKAQRKSEVGVTA